MRSEARAGTKGKRPRLQLIQPGQFRELRLSQGWSIERVADLLKVTERTVRNWEAGTARCPYAAFKLLRIVSGRKLLGDAFGDAYVIDDVLVTTEGHRFSAADLAWWSLVVRQAQEFRNAQADQRGRKASDVCQALIDHCLAPRSVLRSKKAQEAPESLPDLSNVVYLSALRGTFPRKGAHEAPQDPASRRGGPDSNTGQKGPADPRMGAA